VTAWASLIKNKSGAVIRFNTTAAALLADCEWVTVRKTPSGSHIIVKPIRDPQWKVDLIEYKNKVGRKEGKYPEIYVGSFVASGFLPEIIFGKRYKVKKDKNGWIYICLQEPIEKGE
jgi:hypothetical protein